MLLRTDEGKVVVAVDSWSMNKESWTGFAGSIQLAMLFSRRHSRACTLPKTAISRSSASYPERA